MKRRGFLIGAGASALTAREALAQSIGCQSNGFCPGIQWPSFGPAPSNARQAPGPYLYNFSTAYVPNIHAAKLAGVGQFVFPGDSTTSGYGANGVSNLYTNARISGWPYQLAALLTAAGVRAKADSAFGSENLANVSQANYLLMEPRITFGSGVTQDTGAGLFSLGGQLFNIANASTGSLGFAPGTMCDNCDIYYETASGNGSMAINVDGGTALATVNQNAGFNVLKQNVTFTAGSSHTINCKYASTARVFSVGFSAKYSGAPGIELFNSGISGAFCSDLIANTYGFETGVVLGGTTLSQVATFINVGINEAIFGVSPTTYGTNLQTLITLCKQQGGDVVLCAPVWVSTAKASTAAQQAIVAQILSAALANNCVVLRFDNKWISYANATTQGWVADPVGDLVHPNAAGYAQMAAIAANLILAA